MAEISSGGPARPQRTGRDEGGEAKRSSAAIEAALVLQVHHFKAVNVT